MEAFFVEFQHLKIQLKVVKSATDNFDKSKIIGKGGFGVVYQGILSHSKGKSMVAFKRLDRSFGQGETEFWKEILMLSRYTHENLISLLGYCDENGEKILVYEHASNGSLDCHLASTTLTWMKRLRICLGAARGLCYLHDPKDTQQRIIHRDIKSSNILLDKNWNAKISDMGLSKIGPANQQRTFIATNVVGTFCYVDPSYMETNILTKESDIYSFGVVLLEVLYGKLCLENNNGDFQNLVGVWKKTYKEKRIDEIILQDMKKHMSMDSMNIFSDIAYQCVHKIRKDRPKISVVVKNLETALRFQDNYEEKMKMKNIMLAAGLDFGKLQYGCKHQRRRCKIRAPCCNKVFACHTCHNEYTRALNDPQKRHYLAPHDVKQVVCVICNMEQPVGQICGNCGVTMGGYFCGICKLFDDDTSKSQYHCDNCRICYLGIRENSFHCDRCNYCHGKAVLGVLPCDIKRAFSRINAIGTSTKRIFNI